MEQVFKVLNDLEKEGVIKSYALAGATALLFYTEPANTYDVDVFIFLSDKGQSGPLIDLSPLYQSLKTKGYKAEKEYIMIEGVPVQFIPAYNALVEEGVKEAAIKLYKNTPVKVVSLEHLMAIMLATNRLKDRERVVNLLEEEVEIDKDKLLNLLSRHQLMKNWEKIIGKVK